MQTVIVFAGFLIHPVDYRPFVCFTCVRDSLCSLTGLCDLCPVIHYFLRCRFYSFSDRGVPIFFPVRCLGAIVCYLIRILI
jgi:hypothetical protein